MNTLLDPNNRLFVLARQGKRLPHLLVALVLSLVFFVVGTIMGALMVAVLQARTQPALASALETPRLFLGALIINVELILMFVPVILIIWA